MARTITHDIDPRWLPHKYQHFVWTNLEDVSLVKGGTILFDPAQHAHYAGRVDRVTDEVNGTRYAVILWLKAPGNTIWDSISLHRLAEMHLWWADPCMQEEEDEAT